MKPFLHILLISFFCTNALAQSQADFPMPSSDTDLNTAGFAQEKADLLSTHFSGAVGLFHTISAQKPPPGPYSIGVSFVGNYYVKKEFPAATLITERFDSNIAISYTPSKWAEFFLGTGFLKTNDEPPTNFEIQQNFNLNFGFKTSMKILQPLDVGLVYWGEKRSSVTAIAGSLSALNHNVIVLGTYAAGKSRLHLNVGYQINNNVRVAASSTDPRVNTILHAYGNNLIPVALGYEYLFPWASVSLEYSMEYVLSSTSGFAGQPQRVTLGTRLFPFRDRALAMQLGFDYGLSTTAVTNVVNEPPYSFFGGLSYLFGVRKQNAQYSQPSTFREPSFMNEPKKQNIAPQTPAPAASSDGGRVSGYITNIETGDPIEGAKVYVCDDPNAIVTDSEGRYRSLAVSQSTCEIRIEHPDYKTTTETIEISGDAEQSFDFGLLHAVQEKGALLIRVKDVEGNPTAATISFPDRPEIPAMQTNEFGQAKITINPGKYVVAAKSPNMELQTQTVTLSSKQGLFVDFALEHEITTKEAPVEARAVSGDAEIPALKPLSADEEETPKPKAAPAVSTVFISKDQKKIELKNKIKFESNKAVMTKDSLKSLDDLAVFLKKHTEIKRFRVGGHTDATGDADKNLKLSQERSDAVKSYLVKKGINPARIESKGFGQQYPIADNDTPEGQAKNRRVELTIKEKTSPIK